MKMQKDQTGGKRITTENDLPRLSKARGIEVNQGNCGGKNGGEGGKMKGGGAPSEGPHMRERPPLDSKENAKT